MNEDGRLIKAADNSLIVPEALPTGAYTIALILNEPSTDATKEVALDIHGPENLILSTKDAKSGLN